jgi:hypothetical protein
MENTNSDFRISDNDIPGKVILPAKEFMLSFTWQDETIAIQLVNGGDVLKLADIFSKMLTENNIEHKIIK